MSRPEFSNSSSPHTENLKNLLSFISQDKETSRPTPKRQKILDVHKFGQLPTENNIDHIIVNQSTLEVQYVHPRFTNETKTIKRYNIEPYVHWTHLPYPEYIEIKDDTGNPLIRFSIPPEEDRPDIFTALLVNKFKKKSTITHGYLWTEFDIALVRENTSDTVLLSLTIKWEITAIPNDITSTGRKNNALNRVLDLYFPDSRIVKGERWSPQDFYASAYSTQSTTSTKSFVVPNVTFNLYPFQKRTVQWLLWREGTIWSHDGSTKKLNSDKTTLSIPESFIEVTDFMGRKCFVSHLFGIVTLDFIPFLESENTINGGILSEEMGLGKTIEMISLITLHKRPSISSEEAKRYKQMETLPTSSTLIITPPSILPQWINEIMRYAPSLKFMHYKGIKGHKDKDSSELLSTLASSDIVISTYSVLAAEIHYTQLNPEKSLRHQRKYARPKSPLMMLNWWRCMIDEAQMIDSGVSKAAVLARLIPRVNAWCISGTPIKKDVDDLRGLFIFLKHEPYASNKHIWQALITSHKHVFKKLVKKIAIRHSKRSVSDEFRLPAQKRFVIKVPFTPVEKQHYQELYFKMCAESSLDIQGIPLVKDWKIDLYSDTMRKWLIRLRQAALHPQIGNRNRNELGCRDKTLRTVDQVLEAMMEQTDSSIRTGQRILHTLKLKRGQFYENSPRVVESLEIWSEVANDSSFFAQEYRQEIDRELLNFEVNSNSTSKDESGNSDVKNKSKRLEDPASRITMLRNRLRGALEIQHTAIFFCANAYFQIRSNETLTKPDSDEFQRLENLEIQGYEDAKRLRREIHQEICSKVEHHTKKLENMEALKAFVEVPRFTTLRFDESIEMQKIMKKLDGLAVCLNSQSDIISKWRESTVQILLQPLVDEDDGLNLTGNEYENSTLVQEELMVYIQALRTIISDRLHVLTGQTSKLVTDEVRTTLRLAHNGEGIYPEKVIELLGIRDQAKPVKIGSIRGTVNELRAIVNSLKIEANKSGFKAQEKLTSYERHLKHIQELLTQNLKVTIVLEKEVELFTSIMNNRLEYYRQLQQISDMVAPYQGPSDEKALSKIQNDENLVKNQVAMSKSKLRYLEHLRKEANNPQEEKICAICQETFNNGAITACGHQYCEECISMLRSCKSSSCVTSIWTNAT
ncbi:BgTH12-03960 [Blumeria graminis f. sp. triticale]|uniref:BgTH12-03960 n=1 Tax=Blumeria graminis f. sp. triticale TaxID=1689686 RepID=A0A9W4GBT3_BLUGR|nr:BgTH12-03960 [Blumeria graminis f. sp. triticale]